MTEQLSKLDALPFRLMPMTPTIGAEIDDIDLREELSDAVIAGLRTALLDRKVLFFHDQDITTEQHLSFARRFGALEVHPFAPCKPGYPEVLAITHDENNPGRENEWHSDVTWRLEPSLGSILRGIEMPPVGGDTLFCDMYAAYDGLSDEIKQKIEGRTAIHGTEFFRRELRLRGLPEELFDEARKRFPLAEHPVVRTHPETKRKGLYVNRAFTEYIVGMERFESDALLEHLYLQAKTPEYQCRFRWRQNSIAFWDNRACQHYAVSDYWPQVRRVERVTVVGDKPY